MTDWLEQYSAALDARDAQEQAHKPFIDAFTRLADRTAGQLPNVVTSESPRPATPSLPVRSSTPTKSKEPNLPSDALTSLRADLASTQKARTVLQARVAELTASLDQVQKQSQRSEAEITQLKKQKAETERRLKDREEEIRGKASLVENAQDEMVALEMQLNISEQRKEALEKENKELVERWMKRVGEDAERVNRDSRWE